ncbi:MAG: hypothetical protein RR967_00695 [Anaerovoracaceae bacterium]
MKKKILFRNIKKKILLNKYEEEIFSSCILLKNLAIVQENQPMAADYIYEQLLVNSKYLKNIYGEVISNYRKGGDKSIIEIFDENINSNHGKNFAIILSKLDEINPKELTEQVTVFLDGMSEARMTINVRVADRNSVITTMFSSAIIFALLLNFAVVVVFMSTMNKLSFMFK